MRQDRTRGRGLFSAVDVITVHSKSGSIAGAGLDVYDGEPLPGGHPLLVAPRTVLTPHLGYVTADGYRTCYGDAVEDIASFVAGRLLVHVLGKTTIPIKLVDIPHATWCC
ncbi:MAG TPA: NAD(P)-dependent oxidoreductase [Trebonia sp.]|nr:NAD(P)-dependent oxidoreductase [Trebonia sp.]